MQIPQTSRRSFFVSLYQFVSPAVHFGADGVMHRLMDGSVLSAIDKDVYVDLDTPSHSASFLTTAGSSVTVEGEQVRSDGPRIERNTASSPFFRNGYSGTRYRSIGVVPRPPLPDSPQPPPSQQKSRAKKAQAQKPSSRITKRTRTSAGDDGRTDKESDRKRRVIAGKTEYFQKLKKNRSYSLYFS